MGGVATILVGVVCLMYAGFKFSHLITRHKPIMFTYLKDNDYSLSGEMVNLSERNFKLAITIEDFFDPIAQKNDPRYVKWIFRMYGKRQGVWF